MAASSRASAEPYLARCDERRPARDGSPNSKQARLRNNPNQKNNQPAQLPLRRNNPFLKNTETWEPIWSVGSSQETWKRVETPRPGKGARCRSRAPQPGEGARCRSRAPRREPTGRGRRERRGTADRKRQRPHREKGGRWQGAAVPQACSTIERPQGAETRGST